MLLCMAAVYIKNVIIPNAGLEMTDYDLNLTSTILCKDPETGAYKVTQTFDGDENRVWWILRRFPSIFRMPPWPLRTAGSGSTTA